MSNEGLLMGHPNAIDVSDGGGLPTAPLIADTIRHAATACAKARQASEPDMLQAILNGLGNEMRRSFGDLPPTNQRSAG